MTFHFVQGNTFEIWYSGTSPQATRLHLLNANEDDTILVGIWYGHSWRLDVFVGDRYIKPLNVAEDDTEASSQS